MYTAFSSAAKISVSVTSPFAPTITVWDCVYMLEWYILPDKQTLIVTTIPVMSALSCVLKYRCVKALSFISILFTRTPSNAAFIWEENRGRSAKGSDSPDIISLLRINPRIEVPSI
jgi:hypothetical protein